MDRPDVDPALVARFGADLSYDDREGGLGLAVSGGPDSLALLLLAHALGRGRFEVASVDHGLRAESAVEAAFVAQLCAGLGIPHSTLTVAIAGGNVQAEARRARYAALADWARLRGLGTLATAHHADDQAETVLMRLNRASGVAGLAGIRREAYPFGDNLALVRPLLGWRKQELEGIVAAAGIAPVRDPSNDNPGFDRVRIRQAIAAADWLDPISIGQSARHCAEADFVVSLAVSREWTERVEASAGQIIYRPEGPRLVRQRIVERAIRTLTDREIRGGAAAELERSLSDGGSGNLGGVVARARRGIWSFEPEPVRRA